MLKYQKEFIELAIKHKVLSFGEFTLKSGRISPYFFNAGLFQSGLAIASLGHFYAQAIIESGIDIDILFGPAYKGIPLATTTAVALSTQYNLDLPVCYNRKEAKDHGEGGTLVGAPLKGKVAIIDDVITAGTAVREVIKIIQEADAIPSAVIIGLDRQEKGKGEKSAIQEVEETFGIPVVSIVNLDDVIEYIKLQNDPALINHITDYRQAYGV